MYGELVKSLRQCADASCAGCKNNLVEIGCRGKLQREAADALEELSKLVDESIPKDDAEIIIAEVAKPRWIPVTERSPDNPGVYLAAVGKDVCSLEYFCGEWFSYKGNINLTKFVTHWMPIPEPPKEETCDTCRHSPPSSCDGKPCTQCDTSNVYTNCYEPKEELICFLLGCLYSDWSDSK